MLKFATNESNLNDFRPMMTGVSQIPGTKTYFNDTTTVNGIKMYVFEADGKDGDIPKHIKTFIFNADGATYMGGTACLISLKDQWRPVSEKIIRAIKIN
jgi:hypothetical protein